MTNDPIDIRMKMTVDTSDFVRDINSAISDASKITEKDFTQVINFAQKKIAEFEKLKAQMFSSGVLPTGMTQAMYRMESQVANMAESVIRNYNTMIEYGNQFSDTQTEQYTNLENSLKEVTASIASETEKVTSLEEKLQAFDFVDSHSSMYKDAEASARGYTAEIENLQQALSRTEEYIKLAETKRKFMSDVGVNDDQELVMYQQERDAILAKINALQEASAEVMKYQESIEKLGDTPLDDEGRAELAQQYQDAKQSLDTLLATQQQLSDELKNTQQFEYQPISQESVDALKQTVTNLMALSSKQSGITELTFMLAKAKEEATALSEKLLEAVRADQNFVAGETTEQLEKRLADLEQLRDAYQQLREQAIAESVETVEIDGQKFDMPNMERAVVVLDNMTYSATDLQNRMDELGNEMQIVKTRIDISKELDATNQAIIALTDELGQYQNNVSQAGKATAQTGEDLGNISKQVSVMGLTRTVSTVGRLFQQITGINVTKFTTAFRAILRIASTDMKQIIGAVNLLKAKVLSLFNLILAHPVGAVITAILALLSVLLIKIRKFADKVKEHINNLFESLGKLFDAFKSKAKDMVVAVSRGLMEVLTFFERILFKLLSYFTKQLSSLKGIITDGLKDMAQWNNGMNDVNVAISNLTSSLAYLKSSLATAFAPIVTVIEPILTRFMDMLATTVTYVGMVIAMLTGQKTFQKAIRVQKDYAKSLDGTAESAKDATGSLASFDKLNVLNSDKDSGGSGGIGDTAYELMKLRDMELPDWMKDWFKFGEHIGEWLRDTLKGIPWQKIQKFVSSLGKGLADFINGFVSVDGLGATIGETIADAINTAQLAIRSFFKEFDGTSLGKFLYDIIDKAFHDISWKSLGASLTDPINALADILIGLLFGGESWGTFGSRISSAIVSGLENIDWADIRIAMYGLGTRLGEFFNGLFSEDAISAVAESLANLLNSAIKLIGAFLDSANLSAWFTNIANAINKFFEEADFAEMGSTLSKLALNLLDALMAGLEALDENLIGDKLVEFLDNIDWAGIADKIENISDKLFEMADVIWDKIEESGVIDEIISMFGEFLSEKLSWEKLFEKLTKNLKQRTTGSTLASSLHDKLNEWFGEESKKELNTDPMKEAIQTGLSTVLTNLGFEEVGGSQIQGVLTEYGNTVSDVFSNIGTKVGEVSTDISTTGANILSTVQNLFTNVTTIGSNALNNLKSILFNIANSIWTSISTTVSTVITNISTTVTNILNTIIGAVNDFISNVSGVFSSISDFFGNMGSLNISGHIGSGVSAGASVGFLPMIPHLAKGAVIPPNNQFLAMLGDQTSGTNVEAPLSTIEQAVRNVLTEQNINVTFEVQGDPEHIFNVVRKQSNQFTKRTGLSWT